MTSGTSRETINQIVLYTRLAGLLLFLSALFAPACILNHHVDELPSTLPGLLCAVVVEWQTFLAIFTAKNIPASSVNLAMAGLVNPLALFYLLAALVPRLAKTFLLWFFAAVILLGLALSRSVFKQADARPLFGYYLWIASLFLITLPSLYRRPPDTVDSVPA